jgi:hypothetical protein
LSTRGIHGVITNGTVEAGDCLVIGPQVPRLHHGDGLPVVMLIEDPRGLPIVFHDRSMRCLLAYPSHWPAPGKYQGVDRWIYATHERLPWHALVPFFDWEQA